MFKKSLTILRAGVILWVYTGQPNKKAAPVDTVRKIARNAGRMVKVILIIWLALRLRLGKIKKA